MNYIDQYNILKEKANQSAILSRFRDEALACLAKQDLPDTSNEKYKYTDVKSILKLEGYKANATSKKNENTIELDAYKVFIDNSGISISEPALIEGLQLESLANLTDKDLLAKYYNRLAGKGKDPIVALNTLLATDGLFLHLKENVTLDKPILVNINLQGSGYHQLRNLFIFENNSEASIIIHHTNQGDIHSNYCTESFIASSARIEFVRIQEEENTTHLATDYIIQHSGSLFNYTNILLDGKLIRNNIEVELAGKGCENHIYGAVYGRNTQHFDNYTSIDHAVPACLSNELFKSVLNDNSTSIFNGRILVRQDAQQTAAFQTNKNILLSDTARVKSKPQLEIYADDVKCTHGATIGQLDQDELFYMQARGINKQQARLLLINGFLNEVVQKIKNNSVQDYLLNKTMEVFK